VALFRHVPEAKYLLQQGYPGVTGIYRRWSVVAPVHLLLFQLGCIGNPF